MSIRFQRVTQALSLTLFALLLIFATHPFPQGLAADFFLRMDPFLDLGTAVAAREWRWEFLPGVIVLVAALLVGRAFCGHICPMGATLDAAKAVYPGRIRRKVSENSYEASGRYRGVKYFALAGAMIAAVAGVSLVHLGSPLSLVTRLYGLVIHPMALLLEDAGVRLGGALPSWLTPGDLAYMEITQRVFASNFFVAALFLGIFALSASAPRFWCRNLCPAGALMALFSRAPVVRRTVSESCIHCGRCVRECPTGAIHEKPEMTAHAECVVCMKCVEVCPVKAVSFSANPSGPVRAPLTPDFSRRGAMLAVGSGLLVAGVVRTSAHEPQPLGRERPLKWGELIRPPGSVPEPEFLRKCVRCGECMKACPTNTLQPIWFQAGVEGVFSPSLVPRLAACAVGCNVCGQVCPTGAIRNLPLVEKNHAKLGTASVDREFCLVWKQDKKCLVCDEVCPFKAVSLKPVPDRQNRAPFVDANKCAGCGWCESKCPVEGTSAIRVNIIGEIRLSSGSYVEKAREYGLELQTRPLPGAGHEPAAASPQGYGAPEAPPSPQGSPEKSDLPPGFDPK